MSIQDACEWLQNLSLPTEIRESPFWFPTLETIHVLALVLVVGTIARVDLRLLGVANRSSSVKQLTEGTLPITWGAFAVATLAGAMLFSSKAATYYADIPFRLKMAFLAAAGVNMACFHRFTYRGVARWDHGPPPWSARLAGGVSLASWVGVVAAGRWIGFTT